MKKFLIPLVLLILLLAGTWWLYEYVKSDITSFAECENAGYPVMESYPRQCTADGKHFVEEINETIQATFLCDSEKSIATTFHTGTEQGVDLVLSDGRSLSLPQTISASGARYATSGEELVFWNKGNTAFVLENDTETYTNCVEKL